MGHRVNNSPAKLISETSMFFSLAFALFGFQGQITPKLPVRAQAVSGFQKPQGSKSNPNSVWFLPRVSNRPANPKGKVFVIMYHHIREGANPMFRSASKFRQDLENLYNAGFRPVTVTEYVENRMILGPGASPVVITFDDAHPNQFQLRKDGSIDPRTAVGIWSEFSKTHPDFPVKGTWYMLPVMWGQKALREKKVKMILEMGSELGNHTYNHKFLSKQNDEVVKSEIAKMNDLLVKCGIPANMPLCPPYGEYPKNKSLVKSFSWRGKTYNHSSACLAWDAPALSPEDSKFNKYKFERLHGNSYSMGIDYWLARLKAGKVKPFVSP